MGVVAGRAGCGVVRVGGRGDVGGYGGGDGHGFACEGRGEWARVGGGIAAHVAVGDPDVLACGGRVRG